MIFVNIHLHPLLLLFILLSILTGTFIQLFIILTIVLIHELGHYLAATYFKWRINYIMLWIFGGVMKTDESTYHPIKEECIVTIAGPFQHVIIYFILQLLSVWQIVPEPILQQAYYYNGILLLFNLLPIYPLDGGKLMLLLQSAFTAYYPSLRRTYTLSISLCCVIMVMQLSFLPFTWSAFALCLFLLLENVRAWKEHYYSFIRFLLSRLQEENQRPIYVSTIQSNMLLIEVLKGLRRNRLHHFQVLDNCDSSVVVTERECLDTYFKKKHIAAIMRDVIQNQ